MTDFTNIENLENWVSWKYFKEILNWPTEKIAYELNINEKKLIDWVNHRGAEMNRLMGKQKGLVEQIEVKLKEKFPPPVEDEEKLPKIDIKKVSKMLKDGLKFNEIQDALKIDPNTFRRWWEVNLQNINAVIKR